MPPPEAPIGSVLMSPSDRGLDTPPGDPRGTPLATPPGGPPGRGPGRGKIFPRGRPRAGAARAPPGAPRAPPGRPPGAPPGRPHFGPIRGYYTIFCIRNGGYPPLPGGPSGGALLGPPGGLPPGGQKSAHFFGYLITLPVGTKFWDNFWAPPGHPVWGPCQGYPNGPPDRPYGWVPQLGMGGVTLPHPPKWGPKPTIEIAEALRNWARSFVASETVETLQSWASSWVTCVAAMLVVAVREMRSDGTLSAALRAMGGTRSIGRATPAKQMAEAMRSGPRA